MMERTGCFIHGIGTAVPTASIAQDQAHTVFAAATAGPRDVKLLQRLARLTGIERRHLAALDYVRNTSEGSLYQPIEQQPCGPGMEARTAVFLDAAAPLIRASLARFSADQLSSIASLITVTCTHAASPGLEQPIFSCSPVPPTADRWNLGFMGCSAGLAAMRLVHSQKLRGSSLIVACELSSLHFQYTQELDQLTANLLFADGCAAVLLCPERTPLRVVDCACVTLPAAADQMTWFAGNHGLRLTLSQNLPDTLGAHVRSVIESFLQRTSTSLEQINHWVVHPGGPQILDAVQQAMNLPSDSMRWSREVLRNYGNMSSPTVFFVLRELIEARQSGTVLMLAFGPGLTIELALVELGHL